jgi:hypothetical protein
MSTPIRFELEFSGWQRARINDEGEVIRPADAREIAHAIGADMEHRFNEANKFGTLKVKVKQLAP